MRDGSLDDVIGTWIDRIIEEYGFRHPDDGDAGVYYAMLKHAAVRMLQVHAVRQPITDYREEVVALLTAVRNGFDFPEEAAADLAGLPEPEFAELTAPADGSAKPPEGKHAKYWQSDSWKKDFYTFLNRLFWEMKDYALPAGRRKTDFLWDLAEVWVATAASAMVFYAKKDPDRWFATAQMLRHYADLTEADGLRSLSWGRWGRYSPTNREPMSR